MVMRRGMAWGAIAVLAAAVAVSPSAAARDTLTVVTAIPVGEGPMAPILDRAANRLLVPNSGSGSVTVIDTSARAVVASVTVIAVEGEEVRAAALDSTRSRLYVLTDSNAVSVLDVTSARVVRRTLVADEAQDIVVDSARGAVYVVSSQPSRLTTLDPAGRIVRVTQAPRDADVLAVNPRTGRLFVDRRAASGDGFAVVEPASGAVIWSLRTGEGPAGFRFDASGRRVYAPLSGDGPTGVVLVADTRTRRVIARVPVGRSPTLPALDAVHGKAYVGAADGVVTMMDTVTHAVTGETEIGGWLQAPAVDAARNRIVVTSDSPAEGLVALIDTATGARVADLPLARGLSAPTVDTVTGAIYVSSAAAGMVYVLQGSP